MKLIVLSMFFLSFASIFASKEETVSETITAVLNTTKGKIKLTLFPDKAPITVANFINLSKRKYYDGLKFHRVIEEFMIQGGDPTGTGSGGPGYRFKDEFGPRHSEPGILSMANAGRNTNGSQFFITHVPTPWLDGKHSVFGKVVDSSDMDVVNKIVAGDQILSVEIIGDYSKLFQQPEVKDFLFEANLAIDVNFTYLPKAE